MRRGGYAFFASRRCDIFTADLCNSIMPKTLGLLLIRIIHCDTILGPSK